MILRLTLGDEHLPARHVEPELRRLTTVASIGRLAMLPRRSTTVRARSRSASEISQWRAVIVVCMTAPPDPA